MKKRKLIKKLNDYCSSVGLICNNCLIKDKKCVQQVGCVFRSISKKDLEELLLFIKDNKGVSREADLAIEEANKFFIEEADKIKLLKSLTTSELKAEIKNRTRLAILTGNEEGMEGDVKIK